MRVVLYERYSSSKQTELSIEGQDRINKEFCSRMGYEVVNTYVDRAMTGTNDNRPQFQKMIKDAEKHLWEGVVVYKLDRFSRNRYDIAINKNKLKQNGVKLISATENISDDPEGVILESVLEGMAEYYSLELSQKIKRGRQEAISHGQWVGGVIPLGYKVVDHKLQVDEETSKWVIEAFTRLDNGDHITDIARDFNLKGYKTTTLKHSSHEFTKKSFQYLFKNEIYIGNYKGTYYDNLQIIDDEMFKRVNKRFKEQRYIHNKADYVLLPNVYCGYCGHGLSGETANNESKTYTYYVCYNARHKDSCTLKRISTAYLEDIVYKECLNLLKDDTIHEIADLVYQTYLEEQKKEVDIRPLQENLTTIEKQLNNAYDLYITEKNDIVKGKIEDLKEQREEILNEINELQSKMPILTKDQIEFYLFSIKELKDKKRIFDLLVDRVIVYNDKLEIYFNLSSKKGGGGSIRRKILPFHQSTFSRTLYLQGYALVLELKRL